MKKEFLFRALGEVGDDLIHMAEHRKFSNQWKKWVSLAACFVLIISLSALVLPYFPMGCGSSMKEEAAPAATEDAPVAEEEKAEAPAEEAPAAQEEAKTEESATEESAPVEEEAPAEEVPDTEAGVTDGVQEDKPLVEDRGRFRITYENTFYYLWLESYEAGKKPVDLGEQIGTVEDSNYEEFIGQPIYRPTWDVTWFSNHAVDGVSVPQCIYVELDGWYYYGTTYNEKVVARYTAADVQSAIDRGDDKWILDTFVVPIEAQGGVRFTNSNELNANQLLRVFYASFDMNTGDRVMAWLRGDWWRVPFADLEWRLSRFLDEFVLDSTQFLNQGIGIGPFYLEDEALGVSVDTAIVQEIPTDGLYLKTAELDGDLLYLRVGLPETDDLYDEVHYTIRFDEDSWRYLNIETPG